VAAVAATKAKEGQDFFPLTVTTAKSRGGGHVPRRLLQTRRPPDGKGNSHLPAYRTVRFAALSKGWYNEVQVQTVVLSADGQNDPDILSIIGASAR